jgi:hypothetical protein
MMFDGNLWKYCGFPCANAFTPKATLVFLVSSSVTELRGQNITLLASINRNLQH